MEMMNCEQYVMNKLIEKENECEDLKTQVRDLQNDVYRLQGLVSKFDTLFSNYCKHNFFETTGTKEFELVVRSYSFEDDVEAWYHWLEQRYPDLNGTVYPSKVVDTEEDDK